MDSILLTSQNPVGFTAVSNLFIDHYMPYAHGDYVKVYLYLLRCLSEARIDISISFLADRLENTEKDILRALQYWEQKKLVVLSRDKGSITCISLCTPPAPEQKEQKDQREQEMQVQKAHQVQQIQQTQQVQEMQRVQHIQQKSQPMPEGHKNTVEPISAPVVIARPVYTAEQIACMKEDPEVVQLLEQIEQALQRLLKSDDVQLILFLYESLGFSTHLILYLYEYCISMNKTHRNYIERVALNWNRDGICTVEQAEMATKQYKQYRREYAAVAKALGFQRSLAEAECEFVEKWLSWGFPMEAVLDACKRTVLQTQSPNFLYINRILDSWHKAGAHTIEDIKKIDDAFTFTKDSAAKTKPPQVSSSRIPSGYKRAKNRFTSFEQHTYSKEEMEMIERAMFHNPEKSIPKGD